MRNSVRFIAALTGSILFLVFSSSAQIFSPLHIFSTASGFAAPLTQGPDGTLYGTSSAGGAGNSGTVFRVDPDGTHFGILYSFGRAQQSGAVYTNADGYSPLSQLVLSNNVLYGTTQAGGATGYGTIFKINTDGSGFTTLHFFTDDLGGGTLYGGLVLADGAFYGTAQSGGSNSADGIVFKINPDGSGFTNLHNFIVGSNGFSPEAPLIFSGGMLYGTTLSGNSGTVFKLDTNGLNFAVLHRFTNSDGASPKSGLVLSGNTLYGTTSAGSLSYGTLFAVSTDGSGFTNLYSFTNGLDGGKPVAALVLSGSTLYGTTSQGGPEGSLGNGGIFKMNTDGSGFTVITNFAGLRFGGAPGGGTGGLILSNDTLFGAGGGGVFSILTNGLNATLVANGSDGAKPLGGLTRAGDTFYGTTSAGGSGNSGVIFSINTNGAGFDLLYSLGVATNLTNLDGTSPVGTLILANGRLFGVAKGGGPLNDGTIFSVNTNGTGFTNLHSFTNVPDGRSPYSGLLLSGNTLYGTTRNGGISNAGTIFKINTDGSGYQTIYNFTNSADPESALVLSGDTLYGTTFFGGTNGNGSVFKIDTNGLNFTLLYSFIAPTNATDTFNVYGANPVGDLILSGNTLYGTASSGGSPDTKSGIEPGTVFKINTDGTGFTRLHLFNFFDGDAPIAGMALSGDTLYGTATGGGSGSGGTVFQTDTNGNNFATLHSFTLTGGTPMGNLLAATGVIYGTTEFSDTGSGYVFSVALTGAPTVHFTAAPTNGIPPQAVQFTAPGVDDDGNTILAWYWNFDDGTPTFTITYTTNKNNDIFTNYNYFSTQNPLHTYTNNGTYAPSLLASNNNGTMVSGIGPAIVIAYPTSILNGGFETGTFTNWTPTGVGGSSISSSATYKHSGAHGANLSASGGLGYLSQTLSTTPGSSYLISFWLDVPFSLPSGEFLVTWGGNVLMDQTNIPAVGWTNIQFVAPATGATTVLQFGYDNDFFGLDDVSVISVQPVIAKLTLSGGNVILSNTGGISNRTYVLLTSTNFAQPLNQWTPIATNVLGSNGVFGVTGTNGVILNTPHQYFILQMQ